MNTSAMTNNDKRPHLASRMLCSAVIVGFLAVSQASCAAGGYKIARTVAKWNNSLPILPRILIYLVFVIIPVYGVAILLDLLIFNTIDFWEGHVSASAYQYEKEGTKVAVVHSRDPLRRSTFTIQPKAGPETVMELRETDRHTVELYINGVKKREAKDINDAVAEVVSFDSAGLNPESTLEVDKIGLENLPHETFAFNRMRVEERIAQSLALHPASATVACASGE